MNDQKAVAPSYCICRTNDSSGFMIMCDGCAGWFHGACIGVSTEEADDIDQYYCKDCEKTGKKTGEK